MKGKRTASEEKPEALAFNSYLRAEKCRITPERFEVLDFVLAADGHFDADELFLHMREKGSHVSRATVYNTLDLLQGSGLVTKYKFLEGHSKYERTFGKPHHDHLICLECGDIIEFTHTRIEKAKREICDEHRFTLRSSNLQILGICSKCQTLS